MKATTKELAVQKPTIMVDPRLDELFGDRVLFPEKLALAKKQIREHGLPKESGRK